MKISRRKLLAALGLGILIPTVPKVSTGKYDKYLKFREPVDISLDTNPSPNVDDLVKFTDYENKVHYGRVIKLHTSYMRGLQLKLENDQIQDIGNGVQNIVIHKIHIIEQGSNFPWCLPVERVTVTAKAVYKDNKLIGYEEILGW